jgi:hypothetical protein
LNPAGKSCDCYFWKEEGLGGTCGFFDGGMRVWR